MALLIVAVLGFSTVVPKLRRAYSLGTVVSQVRQRYRLKTATIAVQSQDGKEAMVMLPSNTVVTLLDEIVDGVAPANRFVRVQWADMAVKMFAVDLLERGELV